MAEGKWIEGLTAETSLLHAAQRVLAARLRTVADILPHAVQEAERDPEYVHQLRVATRRADAALRIFEPCLTRKVHKAARKRLRRIRRAAGAARDWDVFLLEMAERRPRRPEKEQAGLNMLWGYALGFRSAAQAELESVGAEEHATFDAFRDHTAAAVQLAEKMPENARLLDLARPTLTALLGELEWTASGDLNDYSHLHQVRIAGKRLRYAMEVFAGCFPSSFREEIYPHVEEMQEILGQANDSHVAEARLTDVRRRMKRGWAPEWKQVQAGVESLLRFHQRRLPRERKRFFKWWEEWRANGVLVLTAMVGGDEPTPVTPTRAFTGEWE